MEEDSQQTNQKQTADEVQNIDRNKQTNKSLEPE